MVYNFHITRLTKSNLRTTQFNSCLEFITFLKWAPKIYTNALTRYIL